MLKKAVCLILFLTGARAVCAQPIVRPHVLDGAGGDHIQGGTRHISAMGQSLGYIRSSNGDLTHYAGFLCAGVEQQGAITVSATSLLFTATYNGSDPSPQSWTISNTVNTAWSFVNAIQYSGATDWAGSAPGTNALQSYATGTLTTHVSIAGMNAGTYFASNMITSMQASNAPVYLPITLTISKADQSISFPDPGPQETTNLTVLTASALSGLTVTFEVVSGEADLTDLSNLTYRADGDVVVRATQTGNGNWNPAPSVSHTITVTKATAAVTLTNLTQVYSGAAKYPTDLTDPTNLTVDLTYDGSTNNPVNAGTYVVTGTVVDVMYQGGITDLFTIAKADQWINVQTILDQTYTSRVGLAATVTSGLPLTFNVQSGPGTITGGTNLAFTATGQVSIVTSQAGNTNWNPAPSMTNTFMVNKAHQGITFPVISDQETTNTTPISATAVSGLDVSFSVLSGPAILAGPTSPTSLTFTNDGTVVISANQPGSNYWHAAPSVTNTFNVTKAIGSVTLTNLTQVYDGTAKYPTDLTDPTNLSVHLTYDGSTNRPVNAGSYTVIGTMDDPLYQAAATNTFTIDLAPQIITFPQIPDQVITGRVGLAASGGASTNPIIFDVLSGPGRISGGTNLYFLNVGPVYITADQAGDSNYYPAITVTNVFNVSPVQPAIDSPTVSNILSKTASLGATISTTNGAPVTERGVFWHIEGASNVFQSLETGAFGTGAFSLNVTGIVAGVTNYYQVYAENVSGRVYTVESAFQAIPDAPEALPASLTNTYDFTALWNSAIGATNYLLDVATDSGFASILPAYSGRVLGDITTLPVTGLVEGTAYFYRLRAENAQGISTNSATVQVTTYTEGAIGLTPLEFSFHAVYSGTNPAVQTCVVTNFGETGYIFTNEIAFGEPVTGWFSTRPISGAIGPHGTLIITSAVDIAALNAGTYHATNAVVSPTATNAPQSIRATLVVAPASQTISFAPIPDQVITGLVGLAASGGASTNPIIFNVLSGPGRLSGGTNLHFLNVGPVYITADQAGDSNYYPAITVTNVFNVSPVQPAIDSPTVSNILSKTASLGATITETNGAPVTERGVFWHIEGASNVFQSLETGAFGTGAFSLDITGIVAGVTNYYQAYAENVSGRVFTAESSFLAIPDAPEALPASLTNTYDFTALWHITIGATNYLIDVATDGGFSSILPAYNSRVLGNAIHVAVTGLTEGTPYFYRLRAENAQGISTNSATVQVTTYTEGAIGLTPLEFSFHAVYSGTNPAVQTCVVTNFGETGYIFTNEIAFGEPVTGWFSTRPISGALGPHGTLIITSAVDIAALNAGTYHATNAVVSPTATNAPQSVRATLVVAPASQTISFAPIPDQVITGLVGLAASGGASTNPIIFNVLSGPGRLSGGTNLHFLNVGPVYITADQAGDSNYYPAITVTNVFNVSPVQPAIDSPTVSNILSKTASLGATISTTNGAPVSERGIFWRVDGSSNVFQSLETGAFGTGAFSLNVTGIVAGVTNYYQAYAENVSGRVYTVESSFLAIPDAPEVTGATNVQLDAFYANWNTALGATNYYLDVSETNTFTSFVPGYNNLALGDTTSANVTGLGSVVYYYYRVRAENDTGISTNSGTRRVGLMMDLIINALPIEHDTPAPLGYGTNRVIVDTVVTNTVTTPADETNGVRYACTGWSGTGAVPATGAANTVTFQFTTDSTLTWHWKTQYELTQTAVGGTIEGLTSGWKDEGWIFDLVPVANDGYIFKRWKTNGFRAGKAKLLTVVADSPVNIQAVFTATAWDVDTQGTVTMTGYRIDPYTGLFYCTFEVCNPSGSGTTLRDRFLYAMDPDAMTFLDDPDGTSPSGLEYKDVSAEVKSKLQSTGNRDQIMDPGECVDLDEIAFWTRNPDMIASYFYSRGTPVLTSRDTDGDGIPNAWEDQEGLNKNNPVDAGLDQDDDSVISEEEYIADTNPFDAASYLHIFSVINAGDSQVIEWISGTSVVQELEWAPHPTGTWTRIRRLTPPTPSTNDWSDNPAISPGFYRIRAVR